MRCKVCGKENPDNVDLCFSCGSTLSGSASAEPTHSNLSQEGDFPSYFRAAWRKFARSPLALIFVLCYTACLLYNWLEIDASSSQWYQVLSSLGWGNWRSEIIHKMTVANVLSFVDMLPGTLMAVGFWMICADAWDKKDRPIRLGGLKLVLGLEVFNMIIVGLIFCIALIMARRAFLFVLVLAGLVMATLWIRVAVCITVRNTAQSCMPLTRYVKAMAVIEFISAGVHFLRLIGGAGDELNSAQNCVGTILLGVLFLKYKELMDALDCKRVEMKIQSPEVPVQEQNAEKTEYVPAWKRVQMEKEKTEQ